MDPRSFTTQTFGAATRRPGKAMAIWNGMKGKIRGNEWKI
jgi:hypothetical protein